LAKGDNGVAITHATQDSFLGAELSTPVGMGYQGNLKVTALRVNHAWEQH